MHAVFVANRAGAFALGAYIVARPARARAIVA